MTTVTPEPTVTPHAVTPTRRASRTPQPVGPLGALCPRVATHPPYVRTHGQKAGILMSRAGRPLDAWQSDAVALMLAERPDGQWACYEYAEWVPRQNGKGGALEARALTGFLLLGEDLVLWSAHEYKTAMEAFRRVKALIRALGVQVDVAGNLFEVDLAPLAEELGMPELADSDPIRIKVNNTNGEEAFERLDTLARIKFIARSKGSGRGFSGDLNIIDETFAYTPDQHSALLYTLSARPNPQIIYTSSPPLTGDTGEIMYDLRRRGDPTAPREPGEASWEQDDSLGYRDWGLGGDLDFLDGVDLDDVANWAATNPALGIRITHETVARERRSTRKKPVGFARERFGIWPKEIRPQGEGVISDELWRDLAVAPERPEQVAYAIVVNYRRTHTAIVAAGRRRDGRLQWSVVAHQPGTHWVVARVKQLRERWNPIGVACQDKGPSATLIDPLEAAGIKRPEDRDEPVRGALAVPWAADVAVAYGMTIDALDQREVVHIDDAPLNTAVATAGTRPLGGGTTWDYRLDGAEVIQAASLALWLHETWLPLVTAERDEIGIL